MNDQMSSFAQDRSDSRMRLLARLSRYKYLLVRKWWVLALGALLGVAVQIALLKFSAASFVSVGRMIVSIKLAIPEGSVYTEEWSNFLGTQTALMQSGVVINRAHARVAAQRPDLAMRPVALKVTTLPRTTIFILQGTGGDPEYTQAFVQACMEEYINRKKEMRTQTSDTTVAGLTEEVLRLEKELRKSEEELTAFQSTNSPAVFQDQGNSAGNYLAALNQKLAALKSEHDLLQVLTLDQNLERQQAGAAIPTAAAGPEAAPQNTGGQLDNEYLSAKQQILLLKADQQDLAQYLKPKHPKMIALSEEIARRERLLDIYRQQTAEQLDSRKSSLGLQITNLEKEVAVWDAKTLEISRKSAEFLKLKGNSSRIQNLYDRLLATMQTLDVNKEISPESVTIMENATPASADSQSLAQKLGFAGLLGLGLGLVALFVFDRLDDRMGSFTELQELLDEIVLGQVPRDTSVTSRGQESLISANDTRHAFTEAYRNLRSSLLYMVESGQRPKTLLVTSSIPNEGKSVTAANLAIVMAGAGAKVLLVDADLRKGVLHKRFGLSCETGLSEVLGRGASLTAAVQPTQVPNLSLLPRGAVTSKSSELFISQATARFLEEAAASYDCVVLDTAPVMAADDVTSIAPHLDGVVFIVRADYTSARVARAALDSLYQRRVRVLGLVFNAVRPNTVDYYYYKYKDYYATYPAVSKS